MCCNKDREDSLAKVYRQFSDHLTYTDVKKFNQKFLSDIITEKKLKYFSCNFKNTCFLGKMHLLSKIHERLFDVLRRPVISNCGTPTEKVPEFLDHHLQLVVKGSRSYVKDT